MFFSIHLYYSNG